jgi:hypothetical protein
MILHSGCRGRTRVAAFIATMACALPAAAAHVTSFTVTPDHVVGAPWCAIATVGVAFDPGENTHGPFEWPTLTSVSMSVGVLPGAGISVQCGNYLPIGATSVSCELKGPFPVTTRTAVTLHARVINNNYFDRYYDIIGMNLPFTIDPPPAPGGTIRVFTNLDTANFTVSGPASFSAKGTFAIRFNLPAGSYTITFAPLPGYLTPPPQTHMLLSRGSVTFSAVYQPARELRIRVALGDDSAGPPPGVKLPATAHVPLGGVLHIESVDQYGQVVPARFVHDASAALVAPDVAETALFKDVTLIRYGSDQINGAIFQSVHKGTVTITIGPNEESIQSGSLTVVVENPKSLGATNNDIDPDIYEIAHRYGVLPQFVKAHAKHESVGAFNRLSYRYEPIGPWVGDLSAISRGRNFRTAAPYEDYRLATAEDSLDAALAAGRLLSADDVDVRNAYAIACAANGTGGRAMTGNDTLVSAWEIFRCNDRRMNWTKKAGKAGASRAQALKGDLFTAQTALASSYGILQMTYVTAIDEMKWTGDGLGAKNPWLLFDSVEVHDRQGGSLNIGTKKVVKDFKNVPGTGAINTPQDLLNTFIRAWDRYNSREAGYGNSVAGNVPSYLPVAASAVLGGTP